MTKVTNASVVPKKKVIKNVSKGENFICNPDNCSPLGLAFREEVSKLILKHHDIDVYEELTNILVWSVGHSFEYKNYTRYSPENFSKINKFYNHVKYFIWHLKTIELNEECYTDRETSVDQDARFAMKEWLSYVIPFYQYGGDVGKKLQLLLYVTQVYENYIGRSYQIERERKAAVKQVKKGGNN